MSASLQAGVRNASDGGGSGKMVAKIQNMMRQVTKERDGLKAENIKLQAELGQLKKMNGKLEEKGEKITRNLADQRGSNKNLKIRQEQTYSKLLEVVDKYKELKQQKNLLNTELVSIQGQYKQSTQQLNICSSHNGKLISSANELLVRYQKKGTFDGFLQSESLLQFKSVEMESIVQEYEDEIRDQKYKDTVSLRNF